MNPYVERKYLTLIRDVLTNETFMITIPTKADYLVTIERLVWETIHPVAGAGNAIDVFIQVGGVPPIFVMDMDRIPYFRESLAGESNHVNEELNLTIEGRDKIYIVFGNADVRTFHLVMLVTFRYEKRIAEGKTHG